MEIDAASLEDALTILGQLLADRNYFYEAVAIGGGSLLLLNKLSGQQKI